ncbi:MAG: MerR family transcriptional regulator [Chloroflexaceae bacterium]|jgi:DNA-binding transcriptional MerR regulator|nr:MerR family transcriptional regulator [Chloroflexaceae bacterium]
MDQRPDNLLSIGSFALAAQLTIKALRLYDQIGLLKPAYTDPWSGYRYYHSDQIALARRIRLLRHMAMPLTTIRHVLAASPAEAAALITGYQAEMERQLALVQRISRELLAQLNQEEPTMTFDIRVRSSEALPVISISRHMLVDKLMEHIDQSIPALQAFAQAHGGQVVGAPFGIYHGPVNADDNGPMEVCLPLARAIAPTAGVTARVLPAARLASVTITGEQCEFPAILEPYDALYAWVEQHGYAIDGPPWEIYLDRSQVEKLEIAWPFREK